MLVVTDAPDGGYFIFRGGLASEFLAGLRVTHWRAVVLLSPGVGILACRLGHCQAGTFAVTIPYEAFTDTQAKGAFDDIINAHILQAARRNGLLNN